MSLSQTIRGKKRKTFRSGLEAETQRPPQNLQTERLSTIICMNSFRSYDLSDVSEGAHPVTN